MITPNTQDPSSLAGTMAKPKQATLYDPTGAAKPSVVNVGSPEAAALQKKGFSLNKPTPAQPAPTTTSPFALQQVMSAMQAKVGSNNTLMSQRNLLLKHLYDQPLTPEEKKQLDPTMLKAVESNDRNTIDMNLRLVSDEIQGRNNTLDQSVKYLTDAYTQEQTRIENQRKDAENAIIDFSQKFVDPATGKVDANMVKTAMTGLYGKEYVDKLNSTGFIDKLAGAENISTYEKNLGKYAVNSATGELYNTITGQSKSVENAQAGGSGGNVVVSPDGTNIDLTRYNGNAGYGDKVQSYIQNMGQFGSVDDINNYISQINPNSKITGDMIVKASSTQQLPWEVVAAVVQHETGNFTSGVMSKNNNPGGVTWSQSYQDRHPGVTKGTARPAKEGGYYVKFKTMQDGLNAVAGSIKSSNGGSSQSKAKSYDQYGLLSTTNFNPKTEVDKNAANYLDAYLKSSTGTLPTAASLFGSSRGANATKFAAAQDRAKQLYFAATGQSLPDLAIVKSNKSLITANNKLLNNLNIQEGTINKNFQLAISNIDKGGINQSSPAINTWINNYKDKVLGDPDVAQYLAQNQTVANEMGSLLALKNASGTTVGDKLAAAGLVPPNSTEEQQKAILKTLMQEAENGRVAINQTSSDLYKKIDPLEQDPNNPNRKKTTASSSATPKKGDNPMGI